MRLMACYTTLFLSLFSLTDQTKGRPKPLVAQGTDCSNIKDLFPTAASGVYLIQPLGFNVPFKVFCRMLPDGGWTVFQKRTGGAVSFDRKWAEYKHGFGSPRKDHWLGLCKVYAITKAAGTRWTMKVDLRDFGGGGAFAEYDDFKLGGMRSSYRLTVGDYRGNAGDAIRGGSAGADQNGFGFSTKDVDADGCSPCIFGDIAVNKCTSFMGGGWWYSRCGSASLNGDWHPAGENRGWASGLHWLTWRGPGPYSASASRMMIKAMGDNTAPS
ncbi:angiopoietin-related protein 5-like isoform X1 [Osmerus eperlanus]|uniref:angiopoietin-related protein 5-like isoform X1 n=1 Tax=Osmerus eperlanus TaxID=29151 RepID=UPI002E10D60B